MQSFTADFKIPKLKLEFIFAAEAKVHVVDVVLKLVSAT